MGGGKSASRTESRNSADMDEDDDAVAEAKGTAIHSRKRGSETDAILQPVAVQEQSSVAEAIMLNKGLDSVAGAVQTLFHMPTNLGISAAVYERAAATYMYSKTVICFPAWKEIYTLDDERRMDFESAKRFGETVAATYRRLGYETIELPRVSIEKRVEFIRSC